MPDLLRKQGLSLLLLGAVLAFGGWFITRTLMAPHGHQTALVIPELPSVRPEQMLPHFQDDLDRLTSAPNRLAGSPNAEAAATYVERRLQEMGVQEVYLQRFPLVAPEYQDVTISADGGSPKPLYALRPNLIMGSITPEEGITGQTVYAGGGSLLEYGGTDPEGKIVVLDFAQGVFAWQTAFALGAKAVVFVGDDQPASVCWHHVDIPALLPRFYLPAAEADALGLRKAPHEVMLKSRMQWARRFGHNVIGVIRGRSPQFRQGQPEAILLAAPIDSFGEVPDLANGARQGANAAALLGMAEFLQANRPSRDVVLCFLDGEAQFHAGARAFYNATLRRWRQTSFTESLSDRRERFEEEQKYVENILAVLDDPNLRSLPGDQRHAAMVELRNTVRMLSNDQRDRVQQLRDQLEAMDKAAARDASTQPAADAPGATSLPNRAALTREEVRKQLEHEQQVTLEWTAVQREINSEQLTDRTKVYFARVADETRRLMRSRLSEIADQKTCMADATALETALAKDLVVLHLSLNLGDLGTRWTVVQGDWSQPEEDTEDRPGIYQQDVFKAFVDACDMLAARLPGALADFDRRPIGPRLSDATAFAPGLRADSGQVARLYGIWNLSAVTAFDRRARDGQPCDTVAAMQGRQTNIRAQGAQLALMVLALGHTDGLSLSRRVAPTVSYVESTWSGGSTSGATAMLLSSSSALADRPARDGVVAVLPRCTANNWAKANTSDDAPGFERFLLAPINGNGGIELGPISTKYFELANYVCAVFDGRGMPTHISNHETVQGKITEVAVKAFRAKCLTVIGRGYERKAVGTLVLQGKSTAPFRTDSSLIAEIDNVVSFFVLPETEGLKLFNSHGPAILNNSVAHESGEGVSLKSPFDFIQTGKRTVLDLWNLNESRLGMLQRNHILEESLQTLHSEAKGVAAEAKQASSSFAIAQGNRESSAALSRRVYEPLVTVLNDLVTAVVFLLLLAMPFAYALERLLIGTPYIYRQIGYVTLFFLLTFAVLYFVNPAFRIAATPIVIFLAFAIIILSSVVIFIMLRKLQEEVRRMQGLGTTVHSSDVSRLSTMMAAVNMGISTMRRRPLRTLLTAVTVVLLTFTILSFASFSSTWGLRRTYVGSLQGSPRILVRQPLWGTIDEGVLEMVRGRLQGRANVVPRWWLAPTAREADIIARGQRPSNDLSVCTVGGEKLSVLSGVVGIEAADIGTPSRAAGSSALTGIFPDRGAALAEDGIYLTQSVAGQLGVQVGDKVIVGGLPLRFAGALDGDRVNQQAEVEGSSVLPVDYQASQGAANGSIAAAETAASNELPEVESAQFVNLISDRVGFVSARTARALGARLRCFQIYPDKKEETAAIGEEVARIVPMPVYVGSGEGVQRLFFTTLTEASGFEDLLIPVVLGGLIVFATMLGSVSDREREIYTFSALGLAPAHVASLFFAEASVYAVVGGMGGYLLGQTVGTIVGWMAGKGWMPMPPMNYSSTNAIVTLLIVMGTVLVSTIFPAIKASRSANPGLARMWRTGPPKGDYYDILFPFTVSSYDITGVVSFLKEHFDNYRDTSLGSFATTSSRIFRQHAEGMLGFEAIVALAPFDLGVRQEFALLAQPSEIEGIDEVRILLHRFSGAPGDWRRANRVFISDLRRQLLIWRALPAAVADHYRQTTLDQWENLMPLGPQLIQLEAGMA